MQHITLRRSIREFTGEPVDRAKLETALKAEMAAPSSRDSRPWQFVVVTDRQKVRAVCEAHPYAKFGIDAGAVVLPFGKKEGYRWFDQDMGAATENLLVALANLGLGATWYGMADPMQKTAGGLVDLPDAFYVLRPHPGRRTVRLNFDSGRCGMSLRRAKERSRRSRGTTSWVDEEGLSRVVRSVGEGRSSVRGTLAC